MALNQVSTLDIYLKIISSTTIPAFMQTNTTHVFELQHQDGICESSDIVTCVLVNLHAYCQIKFTFFCMLLQLCIL